MIRALALLLLCLAAPALAQEELVAEEDVVAGLSQTRISITANFDGSEILIFGAVKRAAPPPEGAPLQVIVTVTGPRVPITVRRKDRLAGIWVNADSVEVDAAPSFYAVAASAPMSEVLRDTEDLRNRISIHRAIRSVGAPAAVQDSTLFTEALIRLKTNAGLYQTNPGTVRISEQTLFDTSIALPSNIVEGIYTARIFLTRGGRVISSYSTAITVRKVGLERFLYSLAHDRPWLYGLLSLVIAGVAGWGASVAFRYVR